MFGHFLRSVKNLFEENMKLKSQIESMTQETKPGNNHTPTAYNKTKKIKKSPDTLTKSTPKAK